MQHAVTDTTPICMHGRTWHPAPLYTDVTEEQYIKSHPPGPFGTSTLTHAINHTGGKQSAGFTVT